MRPTQSDTISGEEPPMTALTAILVLLGVFVVMGVVFFVIAPALTRAGKKKRGPSSKKFNSK
jgi:NADH:ubiquinone oxidoreductase subunit 3 (subunit A)